MSNLVERTAKMGVVPDGETIEGVADFMPVAFLPKYLRKFVGYYILGIAALRVIANLVFDSHGGSWFGTFGVLVAVLPSMVGMPTRHPERMSGVRPRTGIAAAFPNRALRYVATDQRLLAIRIVRTGHRQFDRQIVASVPWTNVIGVSARNRSLWTLFTFGFADGTVLTLSRSRHYWQPGGLAHAVNLRALAPLPASELSAPK
jgi:hypothetical protein